MALNFLKRNRKSRKSLRLYRNPFTKSKSIRNSEDYLTDILNNYLKEPIKNQTTCQKRKEIKKKSESLNDVKDILTEKNVARQNLDKGKERIEKLMNEISDLLNSDDFSNKRSNIMIESQGDKANNLNPEEFSEQSVSKTTSSDSKKPKEIKTTKLPLDIQELHNVAAMAKRLRARSKLKKHSIKKEQ
ncbi:MAG: hypothetical protein JXA96_13790 [Sedimentisphaerales bacterium]|nr:hypothetical protein [Sedimentisphaerales bacterium]